MNRIKKKRSKKLPTEQDEDSIDEVEDIKSVGDGSSSFADESSRSVTPQRSRRGKRGKRLIAITKPPYKNVSYIKEDHGHYIFGVQCNWYCKDGDPVIFATVGGNRVSIYECKEDGKMKVLQTYADPDNEEVFYTCVWTIDSVTGQPLLIAAGNRGIIRVISPDTKQCIKHYIGHGQAVNELRIHPRDTNIILSSSKDHSLRLWNLKTDVCIAILGGVDGHRDEVICGDFNSTGTYIASGSIDHSIKIWCIDKPEIRKATEDSYKFCIAKSAGSFLTYCQPFPNFTTREIHKNYVDCVRWFGRLILSKSCDSRIALWKPGKSTDINYELTNHDNTVSLLHHFEFSECDIWFMKFSLDYQQKLLAIGTMTGKVYLYDLDTDDPFHAREIILRHPQCQSAIRQVHFSRDGRILLCVCDDSTVWRWDRIDNKLSDNIKIETN